jgi:hypothetical protein
MMVCHEDALANFPNLLPQLTISYYDITVSTFSNQRSNMAHLKRQ